MSARAKPPRPRERDYFCPRAAAPRRRQRAHSRRTAWLQAMPACARLRHDARRDDLRCTATELIASQPRRDAATTSSALSLHASFLSATGLHDIPERRALGAPKKMLRRCRARRPTPAHEISMAVTFAAGEAFSPGPRQLPYDRQRALAALSVLNRQHHRHFD